MLSMYLYGITKGACLHTARRGLNYRRGGRSKGSRGKWGAQLRPHVEGINIRQLLAFAGCFTGG